MPVWLRRFTIKEINDYNSKINEEYNKDSESKKTLIGSDGKLNTPDFLKGKSSYK